MATLRLKPRTKGAEAGTDKKAPGTPIGEQSPDDDGRVPKAGDAAPAPDRSLREYTKSTH